MRLPGYDYAGPGTFFLTICTFGRRQIFGEVIESQGHLSEVGHIANDEWDTTLLLRPDLVGHAFVVMPNHVHALFAIAADWERDKIMAPAFANRIARSVSSIVSGYKGAVTRGVRHKLQDDSFSVWQRGYHEHIVKSETTFETIYQYILDNPARWTEDTFFP